MLEEARNYAGWLVLLSIGTLVLYSLLLPPIIVRLPQTYFLPRPLRQSLPNGNQHSAVRALIWAGRNIVGVIMIILGGFMLVLPGQGLLTILVGLLLCDFPGKRTFLRWFVLKVGLAKALNSFRKKHGHPPFLF